MNNEDFDIEKFIELFDTAMTSDNPTVRRAFKNLLIVAALVDSETPPKTVGPLRGLYNQVDDLRKKMAQLEMAKYNNTTYGPTTMGQPYVYPSTNSMPTWTVGTTPTVTYTTTNPAYTIDTSTMNSIYNNLNDNE